MPPTERGRAPLLCAGKTDAARGMIFVASAPPFARLLYEILLKWLNMESVSRAEKRSKMERMPLYRLLWNGAASADGSRPGDAPEKMLCECSENGPGIIPGDAISAKELLPD